MKITLKNFRYHTDRTFEFPKEGLVALSGGSGTGKSTILSGIVYALYGKIPGKVKKPYSHGKKTSTVELQLSIPGEEDENRTIYIVRNAKPKTLSVTLDDVEYEGDPAQSIIEDTLSMNYEEFLAGAYIVQRSNASVLSMTPTEQIEFVELLANHSGRGGSQEFKEKLKLAIKECKAKKLKKQGELESLEVQLEELHEPNPKNIPEVPEEIQNGLDPSQVREELSLYQKDLLLVNEKIQKVQRSLEKARKADKTSSEIRKTIQKLETERSVYEKNLSGLGKEPSSEEILVAEKEVNDAATEVELYNCKVRVLEENQQLNEAIKAHYDSIDERIEKLKTEHDAKESEDLEAEVDKLTKEAAEYDAKKAIFDNQRKRKEDVRKKLAIIFKQIKADARNEAQIEDHNEDVIQIKTPNKMIAFLKDILKTSLKCPKCETNLLYDEHTRNISICSEEAGSGCYPSAQSDVLRNKAFEYIRLIEESGRELSINLEDPGENRPLVEVSIKALTKARRIREELATLEARELSITLIKMKARIEASAKKFGISLEGELEEIQLERREKQNYLEETKINFEKLKQTKETCKSIKAEIDKRKSSIAALKKTLPDDPVANEIPKMEKKLSSLTKQSGEIHAEIATRKDLLDSFSEYERYLNLCESRENLRLRIGRCQKQIENLESKLEGYYGLEEAGREAEILSLEETVRSINEHARVYLDEMFKDPIVVRLSCIKELKSGKKTTKLQLNTTIDYQGDTYENIEELSGGERQRCDMAFLMAVNEMVGAKMILLDECLNNLDASINTEVLALIRDLCGSNKLILVVSHEAVRGVFDTEVFV